MPLSPEQVVVELGGDCVNLEGQLPLEVGEPFWVEMLISGLCAKQQGTSSPFSDSRYFVPSFRNCVPHNADSNLQSERARFYLWHAVTRTFP